MKSENSELEISVVNYQFVRPNVHTVQVQGKIADCLHESPLVLDRSILNKVNHCLYWSLKLQQNYLCIFYIDYYVTICVYLPKKITKKPLQLRIVPGETALAFYTAENPTDKPIVGIATYSVVPFEASKYFHKIQVSYSFLCIIN